MLEVVHQTQEMFGPLDVLVCCAGVMYFTLMKNLHVDEWERTVDVNCKVVYKATLFKSLAINLLP